MRHRKRGRVLGRSPSHRRALLRNMASSLILTERDAEFDENPPKVKGRIVTTVPKAKEVRPLVEKCVTLARDALKHEQAAEQFESSAKRGSEQWRQWRNSEQWQQWSAARAPAVAARRRVLQLIGNKQAVRVLFEEIAPRMTDRDGGYTRILRLAQPRLGDAGQRAILEFVGKNDRVRVASERPTFESSAPEDSAQAEDVAAAPVDETAEHETAEHETAEHETAEHETADTETAEANEGAESEAGGAIEDTTDEESKPDSSATE